VYKNHEERGCELARELLPSFGFAPGQIESICKMIMATKIPQSPRTRLERIIADADLDYLGRPDVRPIAQSLFEELRAHTGHPDEKSWNDIQVSFLQNHKYHTAWSKTFRQPGKDKYLAELMAKSAD
jgi:predicted metal-dependent HD superfamily phosphohydrolase